MQKELPINFMRAFKPADIRGVYPGEINEEVAYRVARAFVESRGYKTIVVGYDMRTSTPSLRKAFVAGAKDSGANVIDIGMVRSPMLYFASGYLDLPGAVITASHSPAKYNGIKLVAPQAVPLTAETGLDAIREKVESGRFKTARRKGTLTRKSLRRAYRTHVLAHIDKQKVEGMTISTDIGNGMAGVSMRAIDDALPAAFPMLFPEPDGTFPNRDSDPCLRKNQKALIAHIKEHKADFGIGFDGDGDRIAFLDEKGKYVNCAAIGALIAERLLEKEPGARVVYTNLTSKILPETITVHGGKAVRARVGHTFLKEQMRMHGAIFGAEHSGHFFWRDFYNTDSTVLTLFAVLEAYADARARGQTFSEMMKPYLRYRPWTRMRTQRYRITTRSARPALSKLRLEVGSSGVIKMPQNVTFSHNTALRAGFGNKTVRRKRLQGAVFAWQAGQRASAQAEVRHHSQFLFWFGGGICLPKEKKVGSWYNVGAPNLNEGFF